jgi:hypothetical protein
MNIFFLSYDPYECAIMHCSKHVIKMILESVQMLCAAHHVTDPKHERYYPPYKLAHKNHPCTIWVRTSVSNYIWLCELAIELCKEYTFRYGKIHKSQQYADELMYILPDIQDLGLTEPAQAMPEQYKCKGDAIQAYKNYYLGDKTRMLTWKGKYGNREEPIWYINFVKEKECKK